jgi:glucosamine 6-phosphate synthetase-like amidotransferase/phosphosugar isomerase protein
MVLCGQVVTAVISGNADYLAQLESLPQIGHQVVEKYHDLGREMAENEGITKFAFILYIPPVHFMAYYRSLLRGQDPDKPTNFIYWVELSG